MITVAVLRNLGCTDAVSFGARRSLRSQAVDHPVVHTERGCDEHGELGVLVRGSRFQCSRDILPRHVARVPLDTASDGEQRVHLWSEPTGVAQLDVIDEGVDTTDVSSTEQLARECTV
jgi:hypothetical protein